MAGIDTIEGYVGDVLWYHYDVGNDVLYLRLAAAIDAPSIGEETDDGHILLRDETTDRPIGLTVINWWSRYGKGDLPDSLAELNARIEPWAARVAA